MNRTTHKSIIFTATKYIFFSLIILFTASCSKKNIEELPVDPPDTTHHTTNYKSGVFVINEGNFRWVNASVSFINPKDSLVQNDLFQYANKRSLGDVAESMKIYNGKGYIVVNNSNTVEVVSLTDFKSIATITGFHSPRNIEIIDDSKAYVTNMLNDISVVDLNTNKITKSIKIKDWTESMIRYNDYVFVTCVGAYNEPNSKRKAQINIIRTKDDVIIDSVTAGKEPLGIVIDKKMKIWVLCTGGFDGYEPPSLWRVDPDLLTVEKAYVFPEGSAVPSRLCINPTKDTLYYLNDGVYQMPVTSPSLPSQPFIAAEGRLLYGLGVSPQGTIFVSDAIDYVQDGWVYQYNSKDGKLIQSYKAGRIPGTFCFSNSTN